MIWLTAVGYLLFFVPDLVLATTHHINTLPPFFARLFNWGEGGDPRRRHVRHRLCGVGTIPVRIGEGPARQPTVS